MRIAFAVLGLVGIVLAQPPLANAQRAIVLVRHADRLDSTPDSPLSKAGEARALRLASLLLDAGITAIYTSEFQRTIKTAEPLALALKITPMRLPAADREGLFRRLRSAHADDVVLMVGHGESVPALMKAYGHPEIVAIDPDDYSNLFVLVPRESGPPVVLRLKY
jgi:broad specificity phosphatase PhoE